MTHRAATRRARTGRRHLVVVTLCGTAFVVGLAMFSCRTPRPSKVHKSASWTAISNVEVQGLKLGGLSGLTRTSSSTYLAIPERDHAVVSLTLRGNARVLEQHDLTGIPKGLDTEAITRIDDRRFALGTESTVDGRESDPIFIVEDYAVVDTIALPYEIWGTLRPDANRGIEGVCFAQGKLLVAVETIAEDNGKRLAPFAVYDMAAKKWRAMFVELSSETGKISGIDCTSANGQIVVYAVERHYEVARLLRFVVGPTKRISPVIASNLSDFFEKNPNLEGIAVEFDDTGNATRVAIVSDNQSATIYAPTHALVLEPHK